MKKVFDITDLQHIDDNPIESREREILHYIDNHGYLTTKTLRAIIKDQKQAYQLMRTLIKKGYVLTNKVYRERGSIWYLSNIGKTYRRFRKNNFIEKMDIDSCNSVDGKKKISTAHTTHCTLIEIKLRQLALQQKANISRFVSDRYLQQHFQQHYQDIMYHTGGTFRVADGEFYLEDKAIAFEVELTQKKDSRYRRIYDFFKEYTRYDKVYWFYEDEKIRNKIEELFQEFYEQDLSHYNNTTKTSEAPARCKNFHVFLNIRKFLSK